MAGYVYLVGAGPGDEGLITVKGMEAIEKAEVLVYDYLANPKFLKSAPKHSEKIYVGKVSGNHTMTQENINQLLVDKASEGKVVVRLKGGDPYVFGRGGEEGIYLYENGIDFEVVPGITSAIGGLAYGGIPITHRDYASSFHVITGHLKSEESELDWPVLAKLKGTLVFLMGVKNLGRITTSLMSNGKDPKTPVALVHRATTPQQRVVQGTLETIVDVVEKEAITSPSIIVVGDVVKTREKLDFMKHRPLLGKSVIVTRSRAQNSKLLSRIAGLGGNPIEMPTIEIESINQTAMAATFDQLKDYSYIIFTSINGVEIYMDSLYEKGYDSRQMAGLKIVAIGKSTAKALETYGLRADYIPKDYVAESLVDLLKGELNEDDKVLIPRAENARSYLVDALSQLCSVDEVKTYRTVSTHEDYSDVIEGIKEDKIDYVTFTSSSTVENFVNMIGGRVEILNNIKAVSIGPMTSKTAEKLGITIYKEAKEYTIDGIMDIIIND